MHCRQKFKYDKNLKYQQITYSVLILKLTTTNWFSECIFAIMHEIKRAKPNSVLASCL